MLRKSVLISFVATLAVSAVGFSDDAKIAKGKGVYELLKCKMCHSIGAEGNKKTPLDGVGSKFDEATLRKWVVSPKEMKPEIKKPDFSKTITGEDLDALVAYLASLKKS
jgi:cytochrome c2